MRRGKSLKHLEYVAMAKREAIFHPLPIDFEVRKTLSAQTREVIQRLASVRPEVRDAIAALVNAAIVTDEAARPSEDRPRSFSAQLKSGDRR